MPVHKFWEHSVHLVLSMPITNPPLTSMREVLISERSQDIPRQLLPASSARTQHHSWPRPDNSSPSSLPPHSSCFWSMLWRMMATLVRDLWHPWDFSSSFSESVHVSVGKPAMQSTWLVILVPGKRKAETRSGEDFWRFNRLMSYFLGYGHEVWSAGNYYFWWGLTTPMFRRWLLTDVLGYRVFHPSLAAHSEVGFTICSSGLENRRSIQRRQDSRDSLIHPEKYGRTLTSTRLTDMKFEYAGRLQKQGSIFIMVDTDNQFNSAQIRWQEVNFLVNIA